MSSDRANFAGLVAAIARTHALFAAQASKAINISLTLRNWLIGHQIAEYELQGADRADYGERLMEQLAQQLGAAGLRRIDARELRRFRQFYSTYPQIREAVTPEIKRAPSVAGNAPPGPAPRMLLEHLSFTHFAELLQIDTCMTGTSNSHQRVKPGSVGSLSAVLPPPELINAFSAVVRPPLEKVGRSRQQAQTLATLRDTLLPRLISGQLRLPEAEVLLAEA